MHQKDQEYEAAVFLIKKYEIEHDIENNKKKKREIFLGSIAL